MWAVALGLTLGVGLLRSASAEPRQDGWDPAWDDVLEGWEGGPAPALDGGDEISDLLEALMREMAALRATPVDLNSAGVGELLRIPLLEPSEAAAIVALREEAGRITCVEDLERSGILSSSLARALRPYVTVSPQPERPAPLVRAAPTGPSWDVRVSSQFRVDPDDPWSFPTLDAASAVAPRARVRARLGGAWRAGIAFERDAGERRLLDHAAFHVSFGDPGTRDSDAGSPRLAIVAGDVVADWAQGLLLSGARFAGAEALPRSGDRARGYDGMAERFARRGAFVAVARGGVSAQVLLARTSLDAALDDEGLVSTIRASGYHRSEGERAGCRALTETAVASRLVFGPAHGLAVGVSGLRLCYDPALAPGDAERQRFRPSGPEVIAASADVKLEGRRWRLAAEAAGTAEGGRAVLLSARARGGMATARGGFGYASRDFWMPTGQGVPCVSGGTNGAAGWLGVEYGSPSSWRIRSAVIVAGHPWRTYTSEMPPSSVRTSAAIEAPIEGVGRITLEARVRSVSRSRECTVESSSSVAKVALRTSGRVPLSIFAAAASSESEGSEEGAVSAFGVRADIAVASRAAVAFGLTSVTDRGRGGQLSQYEPSLPGEFAVRSLNAAGMRWYIRATSTLSAVMAATLKLSGGPEPGTWQAGLSIEAKG